MRLFMTVRTEPIQDKNFRMGTVVLELDNGVILTCHNFRRNRNGDLKLLAWVPLAEKWMYVYANNKFTDAMVACYQKSTKGKQTHLNYVKMMQHDRKHKHSGGGSRIYNGSITDYECRKIPLHDFPRCYNYN